MIHRKRDAYTHTHTHKTTCHPRHHADAEDAHQPEDKRAVIQGPVPRTCGRVDGIGAQVDGDYHQNAEHGREHDPCMRGACECAVCTRVVRRCAGLSEVLPVCGSARQQSTTHDSRARPANFRGGDLLRRCCARADTCCIARYAQSRAGALCVCARTHAYDCAAAGESPPLPPSTTAASSSSSAHCVRACVGRGGQEPVV